MFTGYLWDIHMYRLCVGYVSVVFRLHVGGYGVQEGVIQILCKKNKLPTIITRDTNHHREYKNTPSAINHGRGGMIRSLRCLHPKNQ